MFDKLVSGFNIENGQSDIYLNTNDRGIAREYIHKGWSVFDKESHYYLRAPSISLVDLTDPNKFLKFGNAYEAVAYHRTISKYIKEGQFSDYIGFVKNKYSYIFNDLDICIVNGPIVESEYRLQGTDDRIKAFGELLKFQLELTNDYKKELKYAYEFLGEVYTIKYMHMALKFQNRLMYDYFSDLQKTFFDVKSVYNDKIFINMFKNCTGFDKYIVSPNGCFKYLSSLIWNNSNTINKIMFYETHSDPNRKSGKCFNMEIESGERILAIDSLYSGNSVKKLSNLADNISVLGLFPKSRKSMRYCDYVMILDRVIKKDNINMNSEWYYYEIKKILNYKYDN